MFVERHTAHLGSRYLNLLDTERHQADLITNYEQYFDIVRSKIGEYVLRSEDCYNMDEEGFLIGRIHKAGREFNKD
jgi:hypothetical protein